MHWLLVSNACLCACLQPHEALQLLPAAAFFGVDCYIRDCSICLADPARIRGMLRGDAGIGINR
jgi:hypothetical protein